jgi:hypothetical protein
MSVKDGNTELMTAIDGDEAAALIPERVTEVLPEPAPGSEFRNPGAVAQTRPAIPHPTAPFLDPPGPPDFSQWVRKWIDAYAPLAEAAVTAPGSNSLIAKGRRYARAQDRTIGDTEALELGCWLSTAENLDQIEEAALGQVRAEKYPCIQAAVLALAAVYVREYGRRP